MHLRFATLSALGVLAACGRASTSAVPEAVCPSASWTPQLTADSLAAFCSPPGWRRVKSSGIWTFSPDSVPQFAGDDRFSITSLTSQDLLDAAPLGVPSLLSDPDHPCVHCLSVTDYTVHWDSVGDRLVRVETGRATGGFIFVQDRPSLMASWPIGENAWLLVQGEALSETTVATLRRMLGSIRSRRTDSRH